MFLKAFAVWLVFIIAESINGAVREGWLVPALGEDLAHNVSFGSGCLLILTIATLLIPWLHLSRISHLLQVGLFWVLLTLGFEIGLGRLILSYSWERIFADYNLSQGGLMAFGLLLVLVAPLIGAKLRGVLPGSNLSA